MSDAHPLGLQDTCRLPDGRSLSLRRAGSGPSTVVFESGMGFSSAAWGRMLPAVSRVARTICYDRAGIGASGADAAPRTLERLADDLGALLTTVPTPLILIGHSWGGPIVRTLAARRVLDVRALVLVDQTDEHIASYFAPELAERMTSRPPRFSSLSARAGIALLRHHAVRAQPPAVRAELRRDLAALDRTMPRELAQFLPSLRALRDDTAHAAALTGVRTTVITGTRAGLRDRAQRREINLAHAATAQLLGGRLVPAPLSGHNVPFTQPDLIVAEILRTLDQGGFTQDG